MNERRGEDGDSSGSGFEKAKRGERRASRWQKDVPSTLWANRHDNRRTVLQEKIYFRLSALTASGGLKLAS